MILRRLRWWGAAATTLVLLAALSPLAGRAGADEVGSGDLGSGGFGTGVGSFSATAASDAFRLQYEIPKFLAVERFVDGGGPTAQAQLDSLGTAQAFSSFPYPGDLAVNGPGLIAIFTGFPFPMTYPLYIEADGSKPGAR